MNVSFTICLKYSIQKLLNGPTLYNVGPIEVINNPSKYIITRTNIGKYKCVIIEPNGDGIIWDMEFFKETLCMTGRSLKTGLSCKMESGKRRPSYLETK